MTTFSCLYPIFTPSPPVEPPEVIEARELSYPDTQYSVGNLEAPDPILMVHYNNLTVYMYMYIVIIHADNLIRHVRVYIANFYVHVYMSCTADRLSTSMVYLYMYTCTDTRIIVHDKCTYCIHV